MNNIERLGYMLLGTGVGFIFGFIASELLQESEKIEKEKKKEKKSKKK
jgi:hypothetical protein